MANKDIEKAGNALQAVQDLVEKRSKARRTPAPSKRDTKQKVKKRGKK